MPSIESEPPPEAIADARRLLWRDGRAAEYLLDTAGPTGGQRAWIAGLDALAPMSWAAWKVSRQRGKTFAALTWLLQRMGLERGLPGVYLAQTGQNAEAIVASFLRDVEADLPPEWRVEFRDGVLRSAATDSELAVFGTDNQQYRRRRGRKAKVVLLDEAAFYADLLDVEQVYIPQLQTTGGVGLYLSSPPISPAHQFNERCRAAMASGVYVHDTFWSNPRIDHEAVIRGECARLGLTREQLLASTAFRREFLAEDVTEETRAAIPAWTQEAAAELVCEVKRADFYDGYSSLDIGYSPDPSFALLGWHDVANNRLVIEYELEHRNGTVASLTAGLKELERLAWGVDKYDGTLLALADEVAELPDFLKRRVHAHAPRQPYLRVGDNDLLVLSEMAVTHGLAVFPTRKDDKALAVDFVNQLVAAKRLVIHPRCVRTREQMFTTIWNRTRTGWERTAKDHGEAIDCVTYMARNVRWNRDCRPKRVTEWAPYTPAAKEDGWSKLGRRRR